jgi:mRNA-degrading endonuclease RelE of RelBE toxin-antitoxin system
MSEARKRVTWASEAQEQLRAIDRETALHILHAMDEYLTDGIGDVKKLRPPRDELRLRVGDYRIFFYQVTPLSLNVTSVKHRSEAYR